MTGFCVISKCSGQTCEKYKQRKRMYVCHLNAAVLHCKSLYNTGSAWYRDILDKFLLRHCGRSVWFSSDGQLSKDYTSHFWLLYIYGPDDDVNTLLAVANWCCLYVCFRSLYWHQFWQGFSFPIHPPNICPKLANGFNPGAWRSADPTLVQHTKRASNVDPTDWLALAQPSHFTTWEIRV